MEHVNTQIDDIVVIYLRSEKVIRPPEPSDVSVWKDIMSSFSSVSRCGETLCQKDIQLLVQVTM